MTEAEWLASEEPWLMTEFLRGSTQNRKLRLLACAACWRVWNSSVSPATTQAVSVAEAFADGVVSMDDLTRVHALILQYVPAALREAEGGGSGGQSSGYLTYTAGAAVHATGENAWHAAAHAIPSAALAACGASVSVLSHYAAGLHFNTGISAQANFGRPGVTYSATPTPGAIRADRIPARDMPAGYAAELASQADLLHDIFGNPFRPVVCSPSWRTDTALSLVRQMYDSRDFSAMPILADALQDAGCDNEDILNHCREMGGVYVRGCWVVDLVLGKE
jgi:hypothetical protein